MLAKGAESESVRLSALRALLKDMMAVSQYTGLEERLTEVEGLIREQSANADRQG